MFGVIKESGVSSESLMILLVNAFALLELNEKTVTVSAIINEYIMIFLVIIDHPFIKPKKTTMRHLLLRNPPIRNLFNHIHYNLRLPL